MALDTEGVVYEIDSRNAEHNFWNSSGVFIACILFQNCNLRKCFVNMLRSFARPHAKSALCAPYFACCTPSRRALVDRVRSNIFLG